MWGVIKFFCRNKGVAVLTTPTFCKLEKKISEENASPLSFHDPISNNKTSGVARAFPGGRVAHLESQNEEENEKSLRKNKKK